jgi:hypothetical protein
MELIRVINKRLSDRYGLGPDNLRPLWRIVWSENEFEKRFGTYTDYVPGTNILIREVEEWRTVPKYRQYIHNKWILERLIPVPDMQSGELTDKVSYEPIWVFEDKDKNPLYPKWEAIEFLIHKCQEQMYQPKKIDKGPNHEEALEQEKQRISRLQEELFGNETDVTDALQYHEAIVIPNKQFGKN